MNSAGETGCRITMLEPKNFSELSIACEPNRYCAQGSLLTAQGGETAEPSGRSNTGATEGEQKARQ